MAYKLMRDGTLNKDGDVCYCVNTDTSCVANCAAFEERARGRVYLHCVGREIIAPMEIAPVVHAHQPAQNPVAPAVAEPDLMDELTAPSPKTKKKGKDKK
jgi:hypothetical protein